MVIKEITTIDEWNNLFTQAGSPSFHQSWEWADVQKELGYDTVHLGLYDDDKLVMGALVVKIRSKRGHFLFIPHGPIFAIATDKLQYELSDQDIRSVKKYMKAFHEYLAELAVREKFWFIRISPIFSNNEKHATLMKSLGYRTSPIYMHAETMWAVDITPSEEEILKEMRKTTRYLIRKAEKLEIKVEKKNDIAGLDTFWELYKETYTREHFTPFPKSYVGAEFTVFDKTQNASFFFGEIGPKSAQEGRSGILAGSLVLFTKSTGFYHQGASIHTEYPVPYYLQWKAMLEAKRRGCKYYNFYGIYKAGRTPKAWKGLSLFKQGFGGFEIDYLPTQDFVISPLYYFSYMVDTYLAKKRGI